MIVIEYLTDVVTGSLAGVPVGAALGYVIGRIHQHRICATTPTEEEVDQ